MPLTYRRSLSDFRYGPHKYFKIITGYYCSSGLVISISGDEKLKEEKQIMPLALTDEVLLIHIKSGHKIHKTA